MLTAGAGVTGLELECLTAAPGVCGEVSRLRLKDEPEACLLPGPRFFISSLRSGPPLSAGVDGGPGLLSCVKRIKTGLPGASRRQC